MLAAIQVTPETLDNRLLAKIQNGDLICIDAVKCSLNLKTDEREPEQRTIPQYDESISHSGMGRELFTCFRANINNAEQGASIFTHDGFDLHTSGDQGVP